MRIAYSILRLELRASTNRLIRYLVRTFLFLNILVSYKVIVINIIKYAKPSIYY